MPLKKEQRAASSAAPAIAQAEPVATAVRDGELAGALHEVSNALTVVLGWLQHAQGQLPQGPAAEAVEVARRHAALGHGIARRAVGAASTEDSELTSARGVAEQLVLSITPEATRRGVCVEVLDGPADALIADADSAHQIVLNLLLNALAFTPHGRGIRFSLRTEETHIVFRIQDDGPGVPAEVRQGLFVRPHSLRPGGAGIGLSHSHRLAKRYGGNLALLHRDESGACFELRWPTSQAPSATMPCSQRGGDTAPGAPIIRNSMSIAEGALTVPSLEAPALLDFELAEPGHAESHSSAPVKASLEGPTSLEGLRVAVLEDDSDVMGLLELGLGSRGIVLYPLANKQELFEFADSGPRVDAVLIDLSPIASDPQGAIRRLRSRSPHAAVYLISGTVLSTDAGPDISGWIRKPFELGEIYEALSQIDRA